MKKLFCLLVALTMLLCSTALMEAVPAPTLFTPGTYQAEAQGFGGKVQVVITVTENEIVDVAITCCRYGDLGTGAKVKKFMLSHGLTSLFCEGKKALYALKGQISQ